MGSGRLRVQARGRARARKEAWLGSRRPSAGEERNGGGADATRGKKEPWNANKQAKKAGEQRKWRAG
eukprot:1816936-Pleurochrysis_carterae.AAC.1